MYKRICLFTTPHAFMQSLTSGVAACARRVGSWQIDISFPSDNSGVDHLFDGQYEGVIIGFPLNPLPDNFGAGKTKVVSAACVIPGVPGVIHDDREIGRMAAEHLFECGYRNFAFYGGVPSWSDGRFTGFSDSLRKRGLSCQTNQSDDGSFPHWEQLRDPAEIQRFAKTLPKPVAVFALYDGAGRTLVDLAVESGLRVPGDMAVMGVDNDELRCETGTVPLTSIDTNIFRIGYEAGLMLDRLLRGETLKSSLLTVPPKAIVRRQSTSMAAHDDPDIAAAMRFIYEKACDGISVDDVCDHVVISRRRFEMRFKAAVGKSPGDEIRSIRIERAKALLVETDMTVVEIAVRCGYSHISGFATAFRRLVGVLPSEYRRRTPG
jgi:LacI family transcriptional regulator